MCPFPREVLNQLQSLMELVVGKTKVQMRIPFHAVPEIVQAQRVGAVWLKSLNSESVRPTQAQLKRCFPCLGLHGTKERGKVEVLGRAQGSQGPLRLELRWQQPELFRINLSALAGKTENPHMLVLCLPEPKSSRHGWESFFTNRTWAPILGMLASSSGTVNTAKSGKSC